MARLNKKLWEAWQNGYIYSIWATSRSAALRALKSKYGGKFTRIRQYPGIGKENPRRVNGKKKKSIKKRITRALKKFVRSNPARTIFAWEIWSGYPGYQLDQLEGTVFASSKKAALSEAKRRWGGSVPGSHGMLQLKFGAKRGRVQNNPRHVKGAKCAGGRSVSLRNFTGRVIKKRDGTVQILGRTRKTK
jgi:hypothetical protein